MIHAYSDTYLNSVMHNLAALFDIAINAEGLDPDEFADMFVNSKIASGIQAGVPNILVGKSATEMLMIILNRDVEYTNVPENRTPEYWAGWVLAKAQWHLNKPFREILTAMPFSTLIGMYHPYHEADEMKTIEIIQSYFSKTSSLKTIRKKRKLSQEDLALISGVNVRSIRAYEQGKNDITKAQGDTLQMLAKALDCSIEELLQ